MKGERDKEFTGSDHTVLSVSPEWVRSEGW